MTSYATHGMFERRSLAVALAAGALLLASAGLATDQAAALGTAQLNGDELRVTGETGVDHIALRLEAGVPRNLEVDLDDDGLAEATFDRNSFDTVIVFARGGNDHVRIDEVNGVFADSDATALIGGGGNDALTGGSGSVGLAGNAGNDAFVMTVAGSAVIDGDAGRDTLNVIGTDDPDNVGVTTLNGSAVVFDPTASEPAGVSAVATEVETLGIHVLGGEDAVTIDDLASSAVRTVSVNLAASLVAAAGDGEADSVSVRATTGDDDIEIRPVRGRAVVSGLAATVSIFSPEAADDSLIVNTLGGEDRVLLGTGIGDLIRTRVNA